jgi:hypothetical protein
MVRIVNLEPAQTTVVIHVDPAEPLPLEGPPPPPPPAPPTACPVSCSGLVCTVNLPPAGSPGSWCDLLVQEAAFYTSVVGRFALAQYALSAELKGDPWHLVWGDPSEILMVPKERWSCQYRFWSPAGYRWLPGDVEPEYGSYVTIIAPEDAVGTTKLDGNPIPPAEWSLAPPPPPLAGPPHWYTVQRLDQPPTGGREHTVDGLSEASLPIPVAVYVHGYRDADSYGYPAGMSIPRP